MREARTGSRSREVSAGAVRGRTGLVARLWGGFMDWRRREADRTIGRYCHMIGEAGDLYRVYEAEMTQPAPDAAADKTDALRRGVVAPDCA